MDDNLKPFNFRWQLPKLLATGGKPCLPEQIGWLEKQGFLAIVSLEPIPNKVEEYIGESCLSWLEIDLDQYCSDADFDAENLPPEVWQKFENFLTQSLGQERPAYVHCSAGIKRSVRMVRRYLHLLNSTPVQE